MLLADPPPEDVVVGEAPPLAAHLSGAAQGGCIEIAKNLEQNLARKDGEWVDADEVGELFGQEGELGETAHSEEPMKNEGATGMGGRRKVGPDDRDGLALRERERIECLCRKTTSRKGLAVSKTLMQKAR